MRSFELLTDSSSDLPLDVVTEFNIQMIPMTFTLGNTDYTEDYWQSISPEEFYSRMKAGESTMTAQLTREKFFSLFSEHASKGRDVMYISLSGRISGTYLNAVGAAEDTMKAFPSCRVRAVDSFSATTGHGVLAVMAAQKGDEGCSVDETADYIENVRSKCHQFFTVDDLMFLHRGGRLSRFSAIAGSLLGVKPALWVDEEGWLKLRDKKRGRKAALDELVECLVKCVSSNERVKLVAISHGNCAEDAEYVRKLIESRLKVDRFIVNVLGAVIGAHSGPGTIAVLLEGSITRSAFKEL